MDKISLFSNRAVLTYWKGNKLPSQAICSSKKCEISQQKKLLTMWFFLGLYVKSLVADDFVTPKMGSLFSIIPTTGTG